MGLGFVELDVTDASRVDVRVPGEGARRLPLRIFAEVDGLSGGESPLASARLGVSVARRFGLPDTALATSTVEAVRVPAQAIASGGARPVAVYSPGRGDSLLTGTSLCLALARAGFLVVAVAHPHDGPVAYADGTFIDAPAMVRDPAQLDALRAARVDDLVFLLQALRASGGPLGDIAMAADGARMIAFGHSLGGAASVEAAMKVTDLRLVMDLDGFLGPHVFEHGVPVPFVLVTAAREAEAFGMDKAALVARAGGAWFQVEHTEHYSFTDVARRAVEWGAVTAWPSEKVAMAFGDGDPLERFAVIERIVLEACAGAVHGEHTPDAGAIGMDVHRVP